MIPYFSNKKDSLNTVTRWLSDKVSEQASQNFAAITDDKGNEKKRTNKSTNDPETQYVIFPNLDIQIPENLDELVIEMSSENVYKLAIRTHITNILAGRVKVALANAGVIVPAERSASKIKVKIATSLWTKLGGKINKEGVASGEVDLAGTTYTSLEDLAMSLA